MYTPILENAKRLHKENPLTFERGVIDPTIGSFVKVCHVDIPTPERFWVRVDDINEDRITGTVFNQLNFSPLKHGDILNFHVDCIYDVYTGTPGATDADGNEKESNVRDVCSTCHESS